jgi:hypothetical protein
MYLWRLGYGLDDLGIGLRFPEGIDIILLPIASRGAAGHTQPSFQDQGCEADHPLTPDIEVKNDGALPPLLHTS